MLPKVLACLIRDSSIFPQTGNFVIPRTIPILDNREAALPANGVELPSVAGKVCELHVLMVESRFSKAGYDEGESGDLGAPSASEVYSAVPAQTVFRAPAKEFIDRIQCRLALMEKPLEAVFIGNVGCSNFGRDVD
ncbi:Golgi-body localisation protein domain [Striga asiatica]|uniref:Golgi-body localisation protein domain n=1 Tax=Striga asiatica TaxID=4170 RepID=A0A5A7RL13_STRAF|nr:Golgi-body localisation protein domain [Striga asiatica]